jgi:metallophosphoesterase (TIGR00282 family)
VGAPGRRALEDRLRPLRAELGASFCIVNGENAADGVGITPKLAARILAAGADVITLGNHTWRRSEINAYLAGSDTVIRPANFSAATPGRGLAVATAEDGTPVAVINVLGSLFMNPAISMFEVVDELVEEARAQAKVVVVDVHAEATSEKVALARWLDGRVTAVLGTHTHVQTSDARVQRGGTAAMTDVGMTGRPLRDRRGRRPDRGGARRLRRLGPRYGDRAGSRRLSLSKTTRSATRTRSRASTSPDGSGSSSRARSQ